MSRILATLLALLALGSSPCWAGTVTGLDLDDTSDPGVLLSGSYRTREFRTAVIDPGTVLNAGNQSTFGTHFAWMQGQRVVQPEGPDVALLLQNHVSYDLFFQVLDPLGGGYQIQVDTLLRGYVSARSDTGGTVQTSGTSMHGYFDDGSGFGSLRLDLSNFGSLVSETGVMGYTGTAVSSANTYLAGTYSGTRTFGLRFTTRPSPNASSILGNGVGGQTAVLFGLDTAHTSVDPAQPLLTDAVYPGFTSVDGSQHGHFVSVTVEFAEVEGTEVPEPSTFVLLGLGLLALGVRHRGRRSRRRT